MNPEESRRAAPARCRPWLQVLVALLLVLAAAPRAALASPPAMAAQAPLVLTDEAGLMRPLEQVLAWVDPQGTAGPDAALAQMDRAPTLAALRSVHLGHEGAVWLYLRVQRPADARLGWVLELPLSLLDVVSLHERDQPGTPWRVQTAGDRTAVAQWPLQGRYPTFSLDVPRGQSRELLVQVRHTTPTQLPLVLRTQPDAEQRHQLDAYSLGLVFGAILLVSAACVTQAWLFRDRTYGTYSLYALLTLLAAAAYTGVAAQLLWPWAPVWADAAPGFLALLTAGVALAFVRDITGLTRRARRLSRLMWLAAHAAPLLALAWLIYDRDWMVRALGVYLALAAVLVPLASALAWRRGDRVGFWVLLAHLPFALAVLMVMARVQGLEMGQGLDGEGTVYTMAWQLPLLLVALNLRSRERLGAELREQSMASQDPLTGLLAAHLFEDRLRQVVQRWRRHGDDAAVICIELVNHERIRQAHGSAVAEQSLLRSVIKLRRLLRDVDTISRLGEARFGVIMEGVDTREAVTSRGARLIAAGLMPLPGLVPEVTLQFHLAAVALREGADDAEVLQERLAALLESMSARTRRPIRFLEPVQTDPAPLAPSSTLPAEAHTSPLGLADEVAPHR